MLRKRLSSSLAWLLLAATAAADQRLEIDPGVVDLTHSPLDIGGIDDVFDHNTGTLARSEAVNPLVITAQFSTSIAFSRFRIWFLAGQNRWRVETADTLADMEQATGSFRVAVDWRTDAESAWAEAVLPIPLPAHVVRLRLQRLTGDDFVHLSEWELYELDPVIRITDARMEAGQPLLTWTSRAGGWYAVERAENPGGAWTPVQFTKAAAATTSAGDDGPLAEPATFYRVRTAVPEERPRVTKRVLVLNFDPILESENNRRLHQHFGWGNPRSLTTTYLNDLREVSGGYVDWQLVEFQDLDVWPQKLDGFTYDDASFLASWVAGDFHQPDGVDYEKLITDYDLDGRVKRGEIDEVIVWGAPYFGYWESQMVGATAYWCNSGPIQHPGVPLYVIMGLNYERGVAEALHSFGHRAESILTHVYGSWSSGTEINHLWDRFTRYDKIAPGLAACGNVHFPPNALADYEYSNVSGKVLCWADDWLEYPAFPGHSRQLNASEWGGDQRRFLKWWYSHMPRIAGRYTDGRLNNWWAYLTDMNEYAESR